MNPWLYAAIPTVLYSVVGLFLNKSWKVTAKRACAYLASEVAAKEAALESAAAADDARAELANNEIKQLFAELKAEREKCERYFAKISEFERQSTEWQRLYHDQSIGHGNAQALMMGTIENFARELQAKGGRPKIPRILYTIRDDFEGKHELPSRDQVEALKLVETPQPTAEAATAV